MHLLRPLRPDEQDEPELAPLARDADGVLGGEGGQRVLGPCGADVVRLVDHDQHRLARRATAPERREERLGRDRLLLAGLERAEVRDHAPRAAGLHELLERPAVGARPHLPPVDAEVPCPKGERAEGAVGLEQRLDGRRHRCHALVVSALDGIEQRTVLLSVVDGVESQHSSPLHRVEVAEADVQAALQVGARPADVDRARGRAVPGADVVAGVVAQLVQPHEVRVRVQHDDTERRLGEEPLQDRAEGVRLARTRLAAEEGVAVERTGVEGERHPVGVCQRADLERRASGPRRLEPLAHVVRPGRTGGGVAEGLAAAVEHPALDAREAPVGRVERHLGRVREPLAAAVADDDVAAHAQCEPFHGDVEREVEAVHRCRGQCGLALLRHRRSL